MDGSELPSVLGVSFPDDSSEVEKLLTSEPRGLTRTGVSALRKSVYALGGVIGVFMSSSCLMTPAMPGIWRASISEGNFDVFGVSTESTGLVAEGILGKFFLKNERGIEVVGEDDEAQRQSRDWMSLTVSREERREKPAR